VTGRLETALLTRSGHWEAARAAGGKPPTAWLALRPTKAVRSGPANKSKKAWALMAKGEWDKEPYRAEALAIALPGNALRVRVRVAGAIADPQVPAAA
jgi:hypothetical protein